MARDTFNMDDSIGERRSNGNCSKGRVAIIAFVTLVIGAAAASGITYAILNSEYSSSLKALQEGKTTTTSPPNTTITSPPPTTTMSSPLNPTTTATFIPVEGQELRIDCYPEREAGVDVVSQEKCIERGCIYNKAVVDERVPMCYVPQENYGYAVVGQRETDLGFTVDLELIPGSGMFTKNIPHVTLAVEMRSNEMLRLKFYATNEARYEVPVPLNAGTNTHKAVEPRYHFEITNQKPFTFRITRTSTDQVIWDTGVGGLTFADKFLSISTLLPSNNIYGFGENLHKTFRHDLDRRTWPMFARDQPPGWANDTNLYGVHPFYTCLENDGNSHGVFLFNSNAMDYSFTTAPMLTYRTIGGILDFYVFLGPTPESVIQQYTQLVGRPFMPPYWSLGFQLCRYGYNSLDNLKNAVRRTREADIPLDIQYADIDHMDERKIFTIDPVAFNGLKEYFQELRDAGMRTIIILDPFVVSNATGYEPYESGLTDDVYIKWPDKYTSPDYYEYNNTNLLGFVWPKGKCVFPDFLLNRTQSWWQRLTVEHRERIPFDGLWIDMNEPANFATNEERPFNWPEDDKPYWSLKCAKSDLDDPPYRTKAAYTYDDKSSKRKARLSDKTVCLVAKQLDGVANGYDVHSLYGWSQTPPTLRALQNVTGERGIVISRSTFPSSGKYAGHWLGDNDSEWEDLHQSIIGLLEFNLFGIPYIGADICGFWYNTTAEMCKRWMQLGAFYTFSRNHNGEGNMEQDPGYFGMDSDVVTLSRDSIRTRYQLLPYLYTLFHHAHARGNTVIRPLFHEFPTNNATWDIDRQFLWGPALLISPILEPGTADMELYLPGGNWYDYYDHMNATDDGQPTVKTIPVEPLTQIPLHVRGGYILPMQEVANTTHYSRQLPMSLLVALEDGSAEGDLFWDDGVSQDTNENGNYFYGKFQCSMQTLKLTIWHDNSIVPLLKNITVMGVPNEQARFVYVNGSSHTTFNYESSTRVLTIEGLSQSLNQEFTVEWRKTRRPTPEQEARLDCMPELNIDYMNETVDKVRCEKKNCTWGLVPDTGVPPCYLPSGYGYRLVSNITESNKTTKYNLTKKDGASMFGGGIQRITLQVEKYGTNLLRLKFYDPNATRYEVPVDVTPVKAAKTNGDSVTIETTNDPFSVRIVRSTGTAIWDTTVGGLTFADKFLQLVTRLPSYNIYGLGENRHQRFRHNTDYQTWPMFARDQAPGWGDYGNLYGVHPFYTCVEDSRGRSHGVLLLNTNAMEYKFQPGQPGPALTYRSVGGVLDFYVIIENSPADVFSTYTALIGRPYFPPYWSLGFQLCRFGYNTITAKQNALERTINASIPVDVLYGDIDHMDGNMDFTWHPTNFEGLPEYVNELHSGGMKYIIILDPALITNVSGYGPYERGLQQDVYIKWPNGTNPDYNINKNDNMLGYVWPQGRVVFPDFLKPATHEFWMNEIDRHHSNISFDGLWIDMNEPANFGTNEDRPFNWPGYAKPYWSLKCATSDLDDPPYKPRSIFGPRLSDKTLCMVANQNDGMYKHYDVHNLYGWSQTEPTLKGLRRAVPGKRGIVISRSTYPSSGKHAGHWLGDNESKWTNLHESIIGMLEFNMFGIPYIGADICGFFGDSNAELCQRWMQLGAFYTFSRNHNTINQKDQDPAVFGKAVAQSSRQAMEIRYTLLPYLYTLFYHAHKEGHTVIRSLMEEFSTDTTTWSIDRQFLWGPALLISPVLDQATTHVDAYMPSSKWFDYRTGEEVHTSGTYVRLDAPLDIIPLHVRGGYIIPTQKHANNTYYSRQQPFGLIVVPDEVGHAKGDLFWDDGEGVDTIENSTYFYAEFELQNSNNITMSIRQNSGPNMSTCFLQTARILAVNVSPSSVSVEGVQHNFTYFQQAKELRLHDLHLPMNKEFSIIF